MFSKKMVMIISVIVLIFVGIIFLSITSRHPSLSSGTKRIAIALVSPFQSGATHSIRFLQDIWRHYFFLVSVSKENDMLQKDLARAIEARNQYTEIQLSNIRLRKFLNFQKAETSKAIAAEVIGKDPSQWFKTIIIDKGKEDGVEKGFPVVVSEGIVGQVADVSGHYAKVLLIIDRNSAVDALAQRSRARGIINGESTSQCFFQYVLRKHDIIVGDNVISSGLDGVYPKGLRIGAVTEIVKQHAGMFQEVTVIPYVDFEKLEEVLVIVSPAKHDFTGR